METAQILNYPVFVLQQDEARKIRPGKTRKLPSWQPGYMHRTIVWSLIKMRIFYFACLILKKPGLIVRAFRTMLALRQNVWGGDLKKIYKVDGKYYFNQYTPGWPG
jgi:hypothetical protein